MNYPCKKNEKNLFLIDSFVIKIRIASFFFTWDLPIDFNLIFSQEFLLIMNEHMKHIFKEKKECVLMYSLLNRLYTFDQPNLIFKDHSIMSIYYINSLSSTRKV